MAEYDWSFITLATFVPRMQLTDEEQDQMFKEYLSQWYINLVSVQIKSTFRQIIDVALIAERNWLASQQS